MPLVLQVDDPSEEPRDGLSKGIIFGIHNLPSNIHETIASGHQYRVE
jgi:hypothetical protein